MADAKHGKDRGPSGEDDSPPPGREPGLSNAPTVRGGSPPRHPPRPSLVELPGGRFGDEERGVRYDREGILGSGGMGEVHLARDLRIGRRVALKILHPGTGSSSDERSRFLREACVQGQLEHPVIVPVYDIDREDSGAEFFTMKRVTGLSLKDVMEGLRKEDPDITERFSRHRLLTAFQQVCLGIDYAHQRGILHRDLKPANIMFGDFGEVYVLDWGLAKILDTATANERPSLDGVPTGEGDTVEGQILGTPGYMSPEQISGVVEIDVRTDVYALGAILFEMLTLEPLHERGTPQEVIRSTHVGADARASERAPERDVPPELERICVEATALEARDRFASARDIHESIEDFLEGNRDLLLRRELAARHAHEAEQAAERAFAGGQDAGRERSRALRAAGRALALDPDDPTAAEILGKLLLEPPPEVPAEAQREMERAGLEEARSFLLYTGLAFIGFFALPFTMLTSGIRNWGSFLAIVVSLAIAATSCFGLRWYTGRANPSRPTVIFGVLLMVTAGCATVAGTSGIYGPLFLTPLFAMALTALVSTLAYLRRHRVTVVALGLAAVIVPTLLEWTGAIPPSYRFEGSTITILPHLKHFPETATRASLLAANALAILLTSVVLWRFSDRAAELRRRIQLHTWHLRQMVPEGARRRREP